MLNKDIKDFLLGSGDLVVLVSDEFPPETGFGGIGSYTRNMSLGMARQGCRVVVISKGLTDSSIVIDGNIAVIRFGQGTLWHRGLFKFGKILRLERTIRTLAFAWNVCWQVRQIRRRAEVLAIEGPEWNAQLVMVGLLTKWPYAIRIHTPMAKIAEVDNLDRTFDLKICLRFEAMAVSRSITVVSASDVSLNDARRFWPLNSQRLVRTPLPIDTALFKPDKDIRSPRPTIVFVGRLEAKKGVDLLIKALPKVGRKVKRLRCIIVGPDGLDEQGGSMRAHLESEVAVNGLADVVEFVGAQTYKDLPIYLQQGWVLPNPSLFESFGMTSLEAVACGSRTIVTGDVGFAEWLQSDMGAVLSERSPDALAEALVSCLLTKPRIDQEYVERTFGLDAVAKEVLEIYKGSSKLKVQKSKP